MKYFFLSLLLIILFLNISFSQSGWVLQQSHTSKKLNNIFFVNSQTGWCVSDSNSVLKTTNGGIDWTNQLFTGYNNLATVYFINENTGWCCGGITDPLPGGVIYKTTNSGINWFSIYNLGGACINDIFFIDENTGFRGESSSLGFGSMGNISKTTNGGVNWINCFLYSQYEFTSIKFKNANTGWATGYYWSDVLGDSSVILKTTNAGVNWNIKFRERGAEPNDISFYNNSVWVSGKDSSILFSSNEGENWIKQYPSKGRKYNSVFFINENTGWAAGYAYPDTTNIIKTTNNGVSWFNLKNVYGNTLYSVFFIDEYTGWTAGVNGTILKTVTGGLTNIKNNVLQTPTKYFLYQNYPNPFNPVTVIRYSLSENGFITLKVFDAAGKEVEILVSAGQNTGEYSVDFKGEDYPSGIYYYSLYADEKLIDTRKMVLIK